MNNLIDLYVSTIVFLTVENTVDYCIENDVNIEISRFLKPDIIDSVTNKELENAKLALTTNNIDKISLHGACFDLAPTSMDPKIVAVTTERLKQSLSIARYLGAKTIVFHSGYNSQIGFDSYREKFIEKQIEYWKDFIQDNEINDITIALENTYEENPLILKQIYDGVNSKFFKSCIDTGHVNVYSDYSLTHWIDTLETYLHHFHLHNNYGKTDEHLGLLKGTLDFNKFFNEIFKLNKPLSLTLEIFNEKDVIESVDFIRKNFNI